MAKVDPRFVLLLGSSLAVWNPQVSALQERHASPSRPVFVQNQGTWPEGVRYLGRVAGTVVRAERGALVLQRETELGQGVMVRLTLGSATCEPEGLEVSTALFHFLLGDDPDQWRTRVPSFAAVKYAEAWAGIDLVVRNGESALTLETVGSFDHLMAAEFNLDGADVVEPTSEGGVRIHTSAGTVSLRANWRPSETATAREVVLTSRGRRSLGFASLLPSQAVSSASAASGSDLLFSTFLGSPDGTGEGAVSVVHDSRGNLVIAGLTDGTAFPVTPGAYSLPMGEREVTVSAVSPAVGLVYSTVIGGTELDQASDIALTPEDLPVIVGRTASQDFPTSPGAFDTVNEAISNEAFVLCLSKDGDALVFSTYLGQSFGTKKANSVVVRPDGSIAVGGVTTNPTGIPTTPAALSTSGVGTEGFVTVFAPDGRSLLWSTLLGGDSVDQVDGLAVLPDASLVAVGFTGSVNFPVTPGAFDVTKAGTASKGDAFATRIRADGTGLIWSSFFGGLNDDEPVAVGIDAFARPVVVGNTDSSNFPKTLGAFDSTYAGDGDGFVTCFAADGSSLVYSTLIGGPNPEFLTDVAVDPSGIATVTGATISTNFPTTLGAWDQAFGGQQDGLVFRLDNGGGSLLYSTFLSGSFLDIHNGGSLGREGRVSVVGGATSPDYPTTPDAPFPTFQGSQSDQVASILGMLPSGVTRLGLSGASCIGELVIHPASQPVSDSTSFGFRTSGAPPSSAGVLLLGLGELSSPLPIAEAKLWLDPLAPLWPIALSADQYGYASLALPLGPGLRGVVFYAQAFFIATADCPSPGGIVATGALRLEVQ